MYNIEWETARSLSRTHTYTQYSANLRKYVHTEHKGKTTSNRGQMQPTKQNDNSMECFKIDSNFQCE